MANKGLDNVRKKVGRSRTKEEKIRLKDERFLLYKREKTLSFDELVRVREWQRAFPLLHEAYRTKERFMNAFDEPNRASGEQAIDRCILAIPSALDLYFADLLSAVRNWKPQILNYFDNRVTNAYTESMNALIREVERLGRGYRFEIMRARLMYDDIARVKKTSTYRRRPASPDGAMSYFGFDNDVIMETLEYGPNISTLTEQLKIWNAARMELEFA